MDYKSKLLDIVSDFSNKKIITAGDIMLDVSEIGKVKKVSAEAACLVVGNPIISYFLGGAANVFSNAVSLGSNPYLCGVIGDDLDGRKFLDAVGELCAENKYHAEKLGIIILSDRKTTVKRRTYVNGGHYLQQMIRVDSEDTNEIDDNIALIAVDDLTKTFKEKNGINILAFSDYAKGFLTSTSVQMFRSFCKERKIKTIVDPKPALEHPKKLEKFIGCYGFKPNREEAAIISGIKYNGNNLNDIGKKCMDILQPEGFLIITCDKDGAYLFTPDSKIELLPVNKVDVSDVTGAGDTFLST